MTFPNPIGLAAGFDKNAIAPHAWGWLGFGFAELGTVTGEAQSGNPSPRLFRLAEDRAIVNRLGFNNDGAERVAARPGWNGVPAVRDGQLHEIKSSIILQPGPAALTDGVRELHARISAWAQAH